MDCVCSMSQKQGPPPIELELLGYTSSEWLRLASQPQRRNVGPASAMMAIPVASDIETLRKSRFAHLYSTLLPQVTGRKHRRRLASPLHGTLTPGRISVGRPPSGRTGVSLSLTESSQNSLPSAVSRSGGNRWAPYILAALIGAAGKRIPPFLSPCSYRWSWRTLRCCLPLSSRGPVSNVSIFPVIQFSMYTRGRPVLPLTL